LYFLSAKPTQTKMSELGTLQVIKGPLDQNLFLYRGLFIFEQEARRGEFLFLVCQDHSTCGAKGKLLNNPNFDASRFDIVSMDEHHTHYPPIRGPLPQ